ncbi:hypothetical protein NUH30_15545 [Leptospira sp. 85282-16]|uniref:hypothetical protein n=1 Tax=Leptospira sp. 85282-16 TaxID=2971256 RepID=UPI0021C069CE|nr:hypothetical protein [Leptospira sp. 85282-16]MCT8335093.1 hypothetical protein [Leptospira sp. 85282-16]
MKKLTITLVTLLVILNCGGSNKTKYPFEYQMSQTELANENKLEIFTYDGQIDKFIIIQFCKEKKAEWKLAGFYSIVIFDKTQFAEKTTSPISAAYGNQENAMKHIRAVYTRTGFNDYSKLNIYDPNMWEGKNESIDI